MDLDGIFGEPSIYMNFGYLASFSVHLVSVGLGGTTPHINGEISSGTGSEMSGTGHIYIGRSLGSLSWSWVTRKRINFVVKQQLKGTLPGCLVSEVTMYIHIHIYICMYMYVYVYYSNPISDLAHPLVETLNLIVVLSCVFF